VEADSPAMVAADGVDVVDEVDAGVASVAAAAVAVVAAAVVLDGRDVKAVSCARVASSYSEIESNSV